MTTPSFQAQWTHFHPHSWPLGQYLKDYDGENLTRFHFLPLGRPHVLNRDELKALIDRMNAMAEAVLGDGNEVWMVQAQWTKPDRAPDLKTRNRLFRLRRRNGLHADWDFYSQGSTQNFVIHSGLVTWRRHAFDRLFLDLYNLRVQDVLFMRPDNGAVFRPYAVGADVAMPSPKALIDLVSGFYGWLPTHGRGFLRFNKAQMAGDDGKFTVGKSVAEAINKAIKPHD